MSEREIPAEAIEAAAKVYRERQAELGYPRWENLPEDGREWRRDFMRAALEAAAPYIQAEAWDEGEQAGYVNHAAEPFGGEYTNPYRD